MGHTRFPSARNPQTSLPPMYVVFFITTDRSVNQAMAEDDIRYKYNIFDFLLIYQKKLHYAKSSS